MWINGKIDGYRYEAKVYSIGSVHGINGGRVSKLSVCQEADNPCLDDLAIYNYDRGLDFDNAPDGLIDRILERYQ